MSPCQLTLFLFFKTESVSDLEFTWNWAGRPERPQDLPASVSLLLELQAGATVPVFFCGFWGWDALAGIAPMTHLSLQCSVVKLFIEFHIEGEFT